MNTITIDGKAIQIEVGTTVIQAAEQLGIYIPRYCYHPGLSIAGSCRMCLVQVDKFPKLQISCYMPVTDGMVVSTTAPEVLEARRSMLEFLLSNHPLDCPVCDQSGECDLQDFYMDYGLYESRFLENKVKRKKASPIGPHVVLDQERCILCTRCTRFCEEVSKSHELGVFERGGRSVIDLQPGRTLDNPYSGNVIDICPVGALTEREFRFQCRVWYLAEAPSICNGCSRGCNISIHYSARRPGGSTGKRVYRLKPRFNPLVNRWWICDEGRFGYEFIDQRRIEAPCLRRGGRLENSGWEQALAEICTALRGVLEKFGPEGIGVIASPQLSNEDLYLMRKLFVEGMKILQVGYHNPWEKEGFQDDFLVRADKNPNRRGAEAIGLGGDVGVILEKAARGEVKVLYIFQHDFSAEEAQRLLSQAGYIIFQGTNWNTTAELAHAVLPAAAYAEKEGSFTNFEGRIQHFSPALAPLAESRPDTQILMELATRLDSPLAYSGAEDLFLEWRGKTYRELEPYGEVMEG